MYENHNNNHNNNNTMYSNRTYNTHIIPGYLGFDTCRINCDCDRLHFYISNKHDVNHHFHSQKDLN